MRPKAEIHNRESGLTMLELLVAMAILAIGIVGVLRAFSSSMLTAKSAEMHSHAAILAQQVASELERRPQLETGKLSGIFGEDAPEYEWEAEVSPTEIEGLLLAEISVYPREGSGGSKFRLRTCFRLAAGGSEESPFPGAGP